MKKIVSNKIIPPKVNARGWDAIRKYIEQWLRTYYNNPRIVFGDDAYIWEEGNSGVVVGSAQVNETTWSCEIFDQFAETLHK